MGFTPVLKGRGSMLIHTMTEIGGGEIHYIERFRSGIQLRDVVASLRAVISRSIQRLREFSSAKDIRIEIVVEAEPLD